MSALTDVAKQAMEYFCDRGSVDTYSEEWGFYLALRDALAQEPNPQMHEKSLGTAISATTPALRDAAQQALEALRALLPDERDPNCDGYDPRDVRQWRATEVALRAALEKQETKIPITDDHGKALRPQYRIIEQHGNWQLLYDQMQVGEKLRHEFRIQKLRHDIALYPGITLAEALTRFRQKVEADRE